MPSVPSMIALGIIILGIFTLVSISWPNRRGAPYWPTRMKKVKKMLEMANVQPGELVYDLGCGDGRVIVMAARKFKARAVGIEIDLFRFLWCQFLITILGLRRRVKVKYGDLFAKDISEADIVFCYLLQNTNDKLEGKLMNELRPNARVVSNTFLFSAMPQIDMNSELGFYVYNVGVQSEDN